MNILAIDQGTSSTKALVVDGDGAVAAQATAPVHPQSGPRGAVEQDVAALLDSVVDAGRRAVAEAGIEIDAIGIANQGETILAWDPASGEPLGPALNWQDRQAISITEAISADDSRRLTEITGLPLDPYFMAPKMALLRGRAGQEAVIGPIDGWLNQRLTGNYVTDAATASRSLLLDLASGGWSEEASEIFGIDVAGLPEVVDCAGPVGETDVFGQSAPVTGLVVDQQAALFAESCFAAGEAKCTYGTGAFLLANGGSTPVVSTARLASCVAWRLDGETSYCLDGQVYTAGAAEGWLERVGLISDARSLDAAGYAVPDGDVPLFVPALAGLGAPFWSPNARGSWLGLSLATTREDLVRAFVWGLAATVALLARSMSLDLSQPFQRLRADGGLTRSTVLMQAQADLLQAPVELYPSPDATALGVAAFARLGGGGASTPAQAVGAWQPVATFEPQLTGDQAQQVLSEFEAAVELTVQLAERGH